MPTPLPSVVLVGRPNVGKSTLFNRLTRTRRAIVTAIPGTTRDVIAQPAEWQGARFELVDTGGMFGASEDPLHALVLERGQRALEEADLLVLVVDGREGLVPGDRDIAREARQANRPIIARHQQDGRSPCQGWRARVLPAGLGAGVRDLGGARRRRGRPAGRGDRARAGAATRSRGRSGAPTAGEDDAAGGAGRRPHRPDEVVGDDRRPAQRRQVVSGQSLAARGADDRQRDAGHDARLGGHRDDLASAPVPDRGHRRHAPPGRVAAGGQVESVSVLLARRSMENADIVVLVVDATAGATDQDAAIAGEADRLGARHHHRRQQVGPDEGPGPRLRQAVRREPAPPAEVPGLCRDPAPVGGHWRADAEAAGADRQGGRVAADARQDARPEHAGRADFRWNIRPRARAGATSASSTRPRPAWPRRRSSSSPTWPRPFTFPTSGSSTNQLREAFGFEGTPIRLQVRARRRKPAEHGRSA